LDGKSVDIENAVDSEIRTSDGMVDIKVKTGKCDARIERRTAKRDTSDDQQRSQRANGHRPERLVARAY
jgi:hypothetical protein